MKNKDQIVIDFYNRVSGVKEVTLLSEIPPETYTFLVNMKSAWLLRPFITHDLNRGLSREMVSRKYGVKASTVLSIRRTNC